MAKLYVVGIGPGGRANMTLRACEAIIESDVIAGYGFYIEMLKDMISDKQIIMTGMRGEIERCRGAIEKVKEGFNTSIISTGDAGLYGMAGPILELAKGIEVDIIPGVTSAFAAASELGAPIMHDFCTVSLSDLLTPWEIIERRLDCASQGDFVIAIYNPRISGREGYLKKAIDIILKYKSPDTPVGIVKNAGREDNMGVITTIACIDYNLVDMKTVVIVGNSSTYVKDGYMITPRGYVI